MMSTGITNVIGIITEANNTVPKNAKNGKTIKAIKAIKRIIAAGTVIKGMVRSKAKRLYDHFLLVCDVIAG
jgi:hypothetical protein